MKQPYHFPALSSTLYLYRTTMNANMWKNTLKLTWDQESVENSAVYYIMGGK